jgi:hypothetical protein
MAYSEIPGRRESGVFSTDPETPFFHYIPQGPSRGRILAVHGLNASKNVMNILCRGLADAGFEVYSIDLPGHGDSREPFHALRARSAVRQVLERLGPDTVVAGHSLGGALLLDIASERHVSAMVLFSPAPAPLVSFQADRTLLLVGQFDPGGIRAFAPRIADVGGSSVEARDLPWVGHSGGLFRPWVIEDVAQWLDGESPQQLFTGRRLLLLMLILISGLAAGVALLATRGAVLQQEPSAPTVAGSLLDYVMAALAAAVVQVVVNAGAWLRLFATDYLVGFFFLTGLFLLLLRLRSRPAISLRNTRVALTAAACLLLLAVWFGGEIAHTAVSGSRWWRFAAVAGMSLPLFLADQLVLGRIRSAWQRAGAAIVSRALLGAVVVSSVLTVHREAAFLLLLTHLVVLFWIGLWFAAVLIRKRTDPFSAALFAAIVQGWLFAAMFVTA